MGRIGEDGCDGDGDGPDWVTIVVLTCGLG
jgi:hypothetical protein